MKKLSYFVVLILVLINSTSCATILGGQVNNYQRTKPLPGQPQREIRVGALLCDVIFWGGAGVIVDFATCAIYKPAPTHN
jgi:hypothetical protein